MKILCTTLVIFGFLFSCTNNAKLMPEINELCGVYVHGDRRTENILELKENGEYIFKTLTHGRQDQESLNGSWSWKGKTLEFNPNLNNEGNLEIYSAAPGKIVLIPEKNISIFMKDKSVMKGQWDLLAFVRKE